MLPLLLASFQHEPHILSGEPRVGATVEISFPTLPSVENPYDQTQAQFDVAVFHPTGLIFDLPVFWYEPQRRDMVDGQEVIEPNGEPGWRLRWMPIMSGEHRLLLQGLVGDQEFERIVDVEVADGEFDGFLRTVEGSNYLHDENGPVLLFGSNYCWHGGRGTADYEEWAPAMADAGMDYTRLWMCPWAFGVETSADALQNYDQAALWQLDRTLDLMHANGIRVKLCFDYHGMLNDRPDHWGQNDNWRVNPYNSANGGPADSVAEFFTDDEAHAIYRQRLRYLVGRFAAHPAVAIWEFWNEIDNVSHSYDEGAVIAWHAEMTDALRTLDPYDRPVTSSLGHRDWPEFWNEPGFELVQKHSYGQARPASTLAEVTQEELTRYGRPFVVAEYGVDYRGVNESLEVDPEWRGLRQTMWATTIAGGAGNAQSWWWEQIHGNDLYAPYRNLRDFLDAAGLPTADWKPVQVEIDDPSERLGQPVGTETFDAQMTTDSQWASRGSGQVKLNGQIDAVAQSYRLPAFFHGLGKPELHTPYRFDGHFGPNAALVLYVDSVGEGAKVRVTVDGEDVFERDLPNLDGKTEINTKEYDLELRVPIPEGRREVVVTNDGQDWAFIPWVRVDGFRATDLAGIAPIRSTASGDGTRAALWVIDGRYEWPSLATEPITETSDAQVTLLGLEDGAYRLRWYDVTGGAWLEETEAASTAGRMEVNPPTFRGEVAAAISRI